MSNIDQQRGSYLKIIVLRKVIKNRNRDVDLLWISTSWRQAKKSNNSIVIANKMKSNLFLLFFMPASRCWCCDDILLLHCWGREEKRRRRRKKEEEKRKLFAQKKERVNLPGVYQEGSPDRLSHPKKTLQKAPSPLPMWMGTTIRISSFSGQGVKQF
ncbi:MAG: hypothetical protein IPL20_11015 [Saprospiraceae bacterium]|nr:hypothetical protein [Saprospiraceae bacterium]